VIGAEVRQGMCSVSQNSVHFVLAKRNKGIWQHTAT